MSFNELGLSDKVLSAVAATGYTEPTPIQTQAIPHILARRDLLGIAQTGTGKTAAFTLPMLSLLETGRARALMPRTLILEPTRELAAQVEESFNRYGTQHRLNVALLIGGVSFNDQDMKLTRGVDVLIATPGRLLDHSERGKLLLSGVELLVIDEADRMLDMGFIPDIERICKLLPFTRQTLFFSATMPPEIQRLADQFLQAPVKVEASRPATAAATIVQGLVGTGSRDFAKRATLRKLIDGAEDLKNAIIFCNRKSEVAVVLRSLERHGYPVTGLHGDMDQPSRMRSLDAFRRGEKTLLVASDVAARGLDIPDVSHVFNYDVPHHAEDYVHRIGRTGRAGRKGTATTLVTTNDGKSLAAIEALIGNAIPWIGPQPSDDAGGEEDEGARRPRGRGRDKAPSRERSSEARPRARRARAGERPADAPRAATVPAAREERAEPRKEARAEARPEPRSAPRPPRDEPRREARPKADAPRTRAPVASERPQPAPRPSRREEGGTGLGLGEHVPSFLLAPARAR